MAEGESREYPRGPVARGSREDFVEASTAASDDNDYRMLIVGHMLPLTASRGPDEQGWTFTWDEDSLALQLKAGLPKDMEVIYIGCLKVEVDDSGQDEVAATLLENFNCVPAFLPLEVRSRFYHGFCKQMLWPLFHYMLPLSPEHGGRFNRSFWQAYVSVNKVFADKVMEVISPDDDYVWIHDYHLMVLPTFLRKRFNKVRLGFFLHSPFPSSEIYRTLPVRDEILRALLNADLIGFHTFDYARHFLSCCSRMLGLEYESKRGYIGLEYYGRTVGIKILPVGIHMEQLNAGLRLADTEWRIAELRAEFKDRTVLLGVDDMDIFKGIGLKLLALEQLLRQHPKTRNRVVLVQIANPARGRGRDIEDLQNEAYTIAQRINDEFGNDDYQPVVLLERPVALYERIAYYTIAECCVVTAVRDGMNLIPYEYIACREGSPELDAGVDRGPCPAPLKKSMLIVSEFIGCSPSLSGAIRVNPWNIEALAEAMNMSITLPDIEQQMRHEKHFRYVNTHDVAYWARSFMTDLVRTCKGHARRRCYGIGFGLGFRVVALDPDFRRLRTDLIVSAYKKSTSRAILLDYDGTMIPQASINNPMPTPEVLSILNTLCSDRKNFVVIVSGRPRQILNECFSTCKRLGLAAEHGYFYRWHQDIDWVTCRYQRDDFDEYENDRMEWKEIVEPVMQQYTESTDGSYIEEKESAMVWHHRDADPDFGSWQAKELQDHLDSVLANQPVSVKSGAHIVEVKPQGVSKGVVVEELLAMMALKSAAPDFVLCIGDDRSDEDMFESIATVTARSGLAEVFACTVGQKPSKAKYYLDDIAEVIKLLQGIAAASDPGATPASLPTATSSQVSLETSLHI
uniref:alpha,alpha-trehalose-phosphate synthase (UDP-forming) n=1 Tax=Physcomitrium patens TaxID=3218 RepID=A6MIZ2_PHYPA|nr:trehalose-phosphate synthase 5 [Physcomitrium patens]